MMFWIRFRKFLLYFFLFILTIFIALIVLAFVYQNKLKTIAIAEINKQLNGELIIKGDISLSFIKHFPNAAISFHSIILKDKNAAHPEFINAEEFDAGFNTIKIFKGEYVLDAIYLKNSTLHILDYKNGLSNYDVFKNQPSNSKSNSSIKVEKLVIEKCKLIVENQKSNLVLSFTIDELSANGFYENEKLHTNFQIYSIINSDSKSLPQFTYNKPLNITGNTIIDIKNQVYDFKNINLNLAENEIELNGNLVANKMLKLNFKGKDFDVKNLTQLLDAETQKRLKGTEGKNLLDNFNGQFNYQFSNNKFNINGNFNCENGTLQIADWDNKFTNIGCMASFTFNDNIFDFELKKFKAQFQNSAFSFSSNYQLADGEQLIKSTISGNLNLKNLIDLFPIPQIESIDGNIKLDSLQATIKLNKNSNLNYLMLNNSVAIEQLELKTKNGYAIQKLNAIVMAKDDDQLIIENGNGIINGNEIKFSGMASYQNFIHDIKKYTELKFDADNLDINSLLVANAESKIDSTQTNNWIDFPLTVELNCKNANWNKFKMQNTHAEVDIDGNIIQINQFNTETQHGNLNLSGKLIQSENDINFLFNSDYKNLNITSTFEQFENFNQTMIIAENINGSLTGKTFAAGKFDKKFNVIPKSISSNSDITVTNGEMKNVSQLLSLSKYLNVDDLKYLKFATIKNQIEINNGKIIIPEMKIQNNALNINVSGTHTFDNEMDYLFKINLIDWFGKKLGKNADENWEEDNDKKGFNIFLRMTGKGSNLKITRDKKSSREKFKENLKAERETMKALIKADLKGETRREKPIDFKQDEKVELINWDDTLK